MEKKKKEESKEFDGNRVDILTIHNNLMHVLRDKRRQGDDTNVQYYLMHSVPMLDKYKECLNRQVKVQFMGAMVQSDTLEEMNTIIREYLKLVKRYFPDEFSDNNLQDMENIIAVPSSTHPLLRLGGKKQKCLSCHIEDMRIANHDNYFVCEQCGYIYDSLTNDISFKDIDRINISNKYQYDRRTHFKDSINQFQGKQNASIDTKVYEDLSEQFRLHHLIPENWRELSKEDAFQQISKEHVLMFLKETGHTKHYEDVVLIHHQLTAKSTPDISHLENQLLHDFDQLTDLYDKRYRNNERKNFINTQYVLYQLLKRHKFPCRKEDFNILKTIDRKYFHDTIMQNLFEILGWNINPLF
jgi:ribosomal protein S27AE